MQENIININQLISDLQEKTLNSGLNEDEKKELTNIEKDITTLENQLTTLKNRKKELIEKNNAAIRTLNKVTNQLTNMITALGLDPVTYGLSPKKQVELLTSTATSNTASKGRHCYVYKIQENGTMKPHSANNISEIAWYFTDECGGSGKDGRLTSTELKRYLTSQGIDYDKDFQVTFRNGNSIRVSYQDKE